MRATVSRVCTLVVAAAVVMVAFPCLAQAPPPTEETITAARARGVKYLKSKQKKDGSWEFSGHEVGITALCTVAQIGRAHV